MASLSRHQCLSSWFLGQEWGAAGWSEAVLSSGTALRPEDCSTKTPSPCCSHCHQAAADHAQRGGRCGAGGCPGCHDWLHVSAAEPFITKGCKFAVTKPCVVCRSVCATSLSECLAAWLCVWCGVRLMPAWQPGLGCVGSQCCFQVPICTVCLPSLPAVACSHGTHNNRCSMVHQEGLPHSLHAQPVLLMVTSSKDAQCSTVYHNNQTQCSTSASLLWLIRLLELDWSWYGKALEGSRARSGTGGCRSVLQHTALSANEAVCTQQQVQTCLCKVPSLLEAASA